jgi:hypothetical protein
MDILLLLIYCFFVWLIFFKFKDVTAKSQRLLLRTM